MRLATPAQIQDIERLCQVEWRLSPETLMETAGAICAREMQTAFLPELHRGRVGIVCGSGNNGGDGLVVARYLYDAGFKNLDVFRVPLEGQPSALCQLQMERIKKLGISIKSDVNFSSHSVLVDALFGVGLSREVKGIAAETIEKMNQSRLPIVALDLPSGLNAASGNVMGSAVKASMTLTMGLAKPGFFVGEGTDVIGALRIIPIGFPSSLIREKAITHFLVTEKAVTTVFPRRLRRSNKADHGHLLVAAGRPGLWGAAGLCCEAAYRLGAGYVTLAVGDKNESLKFFGQHVGSEVLIHFRGDEGILDKKTAVAAGPGAGTDQHFKNFLEKLMGDGFSRVVLDADALTCLAEMNVSSLPPSWILTPHEGELGRLINVRAEDIRKDRFYFVGLAAQKFGCFVLLKGYRTLMAAPDGKIYVIHSGNAALAKAGTGDVLTGFIGSLLAQGVDPLKATCAAAYFHGMSADEWLRSGHDGRSLMPRDILERTPELLKRLTGTGHLSYP